MRRRIRRTPLVALAQGLCAGVIGNAVFTAYQELTSASGTENRPIGARHRSLRR